MSDPLSVTAGVVGILSFGIQVCNGVTEYYKNWKNYDEDVKTTYEMIDQLSGTFSLVNQKVESSLLKRRPAASQVVASIKLCEDNILALENRLNKIKAKEPNLATTKRDMAVGELKKQGKRLLYPFKQGTLGKLKDVVGELRDNLAPALAVLSLDVGEEALVEIRAVRAESQAWRSEERTHQVLNWLSPLEFHSRQQAVLEKRCGETAGWILEDENFVQWCDSVDAPKGLWCQGKMGSGKSVITSVVVDHLQRQFSKNDTAVVYLYCDWQDSEAQNIENLIECLLKQVVETSPDMPHMIDEAFAKHKRGKTPLTLPESIALLRETCTPFERVYLAIDAIDECNFGLGLENSKMLQMENILVDLLRDSSCDLRIFMTSRFEPCSAVKSLVREIEIQARAMDLEEYVMSSLTNKDIASPWASPELETKVQNDALLLQHICEQCIALSDEMFLLPQLHITHLKRQVNMRQFRKALKELPSNLNTSIDTSLKRLQSQPTHLQEIGARVLVWVAYAKRPMTISELQHALAVEDDDEEFFEDGISPEHILTSSCAGLIALDPNTKIVPFINMSIREYLSQMNPPLYLDPQLYILRTCMRYLRFCELAVLPIKLKYGDTTNPTGLQNQKSMESQFTSYPFLKYAAKYWGQYAKEELEETALETIVDLIWDTQRANFLFAAFYVASSYTLESCPSWVSGLHLAAFFGLPLTLTAILLRLEEKESLGRRQVLDQGDSLGRTPLLLAVARGNTKIIKLLLSNKANVRGGAIFPAIGRKPQNGALEIAAEEGHRYIVTLLLEHGAKFGGDAGVYGGALEAAVFKGHEEIVQLLLQAGANIQATVLQSAVYSGNIKIMRYLLTSMLQQARLEGLQAGKEGESDTSGTMYHKNHIRAEDDELHPTTRMQLALYAASLAGRVLIARLLFEYGADVNAETTGFHCTALAAACAHGHDEMVTMFLKEGANVNQILPKQKSKRRSVLPRDYGWRLRQEGSESGRHGTALQAAAYAGNASTVELLLLRGADPNAFGGYYGTALQAAAFGGSFEVVEALLKYGAEVNTSSGVYGNPLQAALLNGNGAIVGKLLEAGADANAEGGRWAYPIIAAAQTGILTNLELLLDANANINATSEATGTALYVAVTAQPNLETTKTPFPPFSQEPLTTEFDDFVAFAQRTYAVGRLQSPHIFGNFLTFAAKEIFLDPDSLPQLSATPDIQGLLDCAKILLEAKADPNLKGGKYGTPLLGAVAIGNLEAVKVLIKAGADVSFQLMRAEDPSSFIDGNDCQGQSEDESESWSEYDSGSWSDRGSENRIEDGSEGRSEAGSEERREAESEGGSEAEPEDRRKVESEGRSEDESKGLGYYLFREIEPETPLAMAVRDGNVGIIRLLIDAGADPTEKSYPHGDTLSHHCGSESAMELLINEGVEVEKANRWGLTPLHIAAWKGSLSMVRTLLGFGCSATCLALDSQTPLHLVASASHWSWPENTKCEVIDALLGAGADINARDKNDNTPLSLTDQQDINTVVHLLKADSNISFDNKWLKVLIPGWGPKYVEAIRWLLENGADVNQGANIELELEPVPELVAQKIFGDHALKSPSQVKSSAEIYKYSPVPSHTEEIESISKPLDVDAEDELIIKSGSELKVLRMGLDYHERLKDCNPLLRLAGNGPDEPKRLQLLLEAKIDLSSFGKNALLLAVQSGNVHIARTLLSAGVEITRTDMQAAVYTGALRSSFHRFGWLGLTLGDFKTFLFEERRETWHELLEMAKA